MKRMGKITLTLGMLFLAAAVCTTVYAADDVVKVAPDHCKVVLDNENVRVIEYSSKPGDKIGMHWHPAHVVYVISGSKTKFTTEDGKVTERELKAGESVYIEEVTHATEHMGSEELRVVIVEIKKK